MEFAATKGNPMTKSAGVWGKRVDFIAPSIEEAKKIALGKIKTRWDRLLCRPPRHLLLVQKPFLFVPENRAWWWDRKTGWEALSSKASWLPPQMFSHYPTTQDAQAVADLLENESTDAAGGKKPNN